MSKTTIKGLIITIIAFLIFGLVGYFGIYLQTALAPGGLTVESISPDYRVISNQKELENMNFLIKAVITGRSQSIVGETLNPTEFSEKSGYTPNKPFTIRAEKVMNTISWDLESTSPINRIYEYKLVRQRAGVFSSAPSCPSNTIVEYSSSNKQFLDVIKYFNVIAFISSQFKDRFCIVTTTLGQAGRLGDSFEEVSANLVLDVGGVKSTPVKISNVNAGSVTLKDAKTGMVIGNVQQTGLKSTGVDTKTKVANTFTPVYLNSNWKIVKSTTFNLYKEEAANLERYNIFKPNTNCGTFESPNACVARAIDDQLRRVNNALQKVKSESEQIEGGSTILNPSSLSNGQVVIISNGVKWSYLDVVLQLRASWVGVSIPVSEPEFVGSLKCEIVSGQEGFIRGTIRNDGDSIGKVGFEVSGCDPIRASQSPDYTSVIVSAGGQTSFSIPINSGGFIGNKNCVVIGRDVEYGDAKTNPAKVTCAVKEPLRCEGGETEIKGLCVYKCNTVRNQMESLLCCNKRVPLLRSDGTYYCDETPPPPTPPGCIPEKEICDDKEDNDCDALIDSDDPDCKGIVEECKPILRLFGVNVIPSFGIRQKTIIEKGRGWLSNLFFGTSKTDYTSCVGLTQGISYIVGIMMLILSTLLITLQFNKMFKKSKGLKVLGFFIALFVGFLLYILTVGIFWVGLIIFVLLIIILVVLKVALGSIGLRG